MKRLCRLFCIFLFCFSEVAYGDAKIVKELPSELVAEASASYVLGDNDTRIDARNIALNAAKRAASELVGTHVKSELVIENDQVLRDQITVVAAAFLKVEVIKEEMAMTKDHRSMIQITIRAYLDKTTIRSKIDSYRSDTKRQEELHGLQEENTRLQKELESLNAELSKVHSIGSSGSSSSQKPQAELVARRDAVISHLEDNQGQVRRVFEKGALLGLARQTVVEYNAALEVVDEQFLGYIQNNTKVTMSEPKFIDNENGTFDVVIGVSWISDPAPAEKILGDFLAVVHTYDTDLRSEFIVGPAKDLQHPFTFKLLKHLASKRVVIRVEIGDKSSDLTIAADDSILAQRFSWIPNGDEKTQYLKRHLPKYFEKQKNPMVLKSIPEAMLEQQTSISAKVIIVDISNNSKR